MRELEALIVPGEEDGENPTSGETEVTVGRGHVVPAGGVVGQQMLIEGHGTLQQITADEAGQRQDRRHPPNEPHAQVPVDEVGGSGGLLMMYLHEMTHEGAGVAGIPGGAFRGLHAGNAVTASRAVILKPEKNGISKKTGTASTATAIATTQPEAEGGPGESVEPIYATGGLEAQCPVDKIGVGKRRQQQRGQRGGLEGPAGRSSDERAAGSNGDAIGQPSKGRSTFGTAPGGGTAPFVAAGAEATQLAAGPTVGS